MKIGSIIRKIRLSKKMTVKELAEKTNLTSSLISQVERDTISPSLGTLVKISKSLNVPLASFFSQKMNNSTATVVIRNKERKKIILPTSHITYNVLSPDENRKIEFLLVEIDESQDQISNEDELISHVGEECGYVIKGKLEVRLGEEKYYLEEGDSIYFQSTIPHRFKNVCKGKSISIWAGTPPSF